MHTELLIASLNKLQMGKTATSRQFLILLLIVFCYIVLNSIFFSLFIIVLCAMVEKHKCCIF
jgi:hypothetical protein